MYSRSLGEIWREQGKESGLKVRFFDWSFQIRYFEILAESSDGKKLVGKLDNGEQISYPKMSMGWQVYSKDMELNAKAC